jgi:aspartate/methionine/tyrosine aminotransferase
MGAYFAYIRHPLSGIHAAEIAKQLAREKGVLLIPGNYFGPNQDQYLRLSFGNLTMETLATLPERLRL